MKYWIYALGTILAISGCAKLQPNAENQTVSSSSAQGPVMASAKDFTAFSILGQTGTIGANTVDITVPFGTNVTALVATFTTTGASVNISGTNQVSGTTANNFTTAKVYTVVAADASTKNYTVTVTVAANNAKDITAFSILGQTGTIGANTVDVTVPFGTNVTALVATFTTTGASVNISGTNQVSGTTANNFTTAKTYTVVAADASTKNYTVTVTVAANNAKDITAFSILGQTGTIGANTVDVTVPFGTNVTALVATFTTTGASVNISGTNQVSGTTANNFTTAKVYTVVAADASTKNYTVTVTVAANPAKDITAFSILGQAGTIGANTIDLTVPFGTNVTALIATFTITGASVNISGTNQVSGTTANNFTTAKTYTVVAADASTKNYNVNVCVPALMGGDSSNCPLTLTSSVSTIVGSAQGCSPFCASGDTDGSGIGTSFSNPAGITTDGTSLFIADSTNNKIRKIVIATGAVTTLAGPAQGASTAGDTDGTGNVARFNGPFGITTDGTNLFVADTGNHKIRKIVIATGVVTTIAGPAQGCYNLCAAGTTDGTGNAARFNAPQGITTDGTNLYIADTGNREIRKIVIATGVVSSFAGPGPSSTIAGDTDGSGSSALFYYPTGITTDGTNLYVADRDNNKIRKIVISTRNVTTIAGPAQGCYNSCSGVSADGTGSAARFAAPTGITSDGTNLYVVDTNPGNVGNIRKIAISTGVVTTIAGGSSQNDTDGAGSSARFRNPYGVTTDGLKLFITDAGNNKVRRIQ